ncbi:MAG: diacylglycerol kinase family lipid kinase [Deltaproteobacteria bacterium]|nr:diacylglycerol kinase family lipid kinase [Deltaproteobacteria bacterium]
MDATAFILNPMARSGRARTRLEAVRSFARERLPKARLFATEAPGHASLLAQEAGRAGVRRLFSVGGDGTFNEVVNGVMALPPEARPAVGLVSAGTGRDFFRHLAEIFTFPKDDSWILEAKEVPADVGRAELGYANGPVVRYYMNIADAGISGEVVRRVAGSRKRLGSLEYLKSTLQAVWSYRAPRVKIRILETGGSTWEKDMVLLIAVAANSRYFGGGMCIAPGAEIDDGKFFLMTAERVGYFSLLRRLPSLYAKKKLKHPRIHYAEGTRMEIVSYTGDLPIGLDGEFLRAPRVSFELVPRALRILVPAANTRPFSPA